MLAFRSSRRGLLFGQVLVGARSAMFQTVPRSQYPHTAGPLHSSTTSNIASCSCSPLVFGLHSLHHTMQSSAMLRNTPAQCSGQPAPAAFLRTCRPSPFGRRAPQMARSFGPYGYGEPSAVKPVQTRFIPQAKAHTQTCDTGPFVGQFGVNTNDRAVREMMQAFEQAMRPSSACQPSQQSSPQSTGDVRLNVDAVETDDAYTYWADVPGLEKSDLKVRHALELPAGG